MEQQCVSCDKETKACEENDCSNPMLHCDTCGAMYVDMASWELCEKCGGWFHTLCGECHTSECYDNGICGAESPEEAAVLTLTHAPNSVTTSWPFNAETGCLACAFTKITGYPGILVILPCKSKKLQGGANKTCKWYPHWEDKGSPGWTNILKHTKIYKTTASGITVTNDTTVTTKKSPWPFSAPHTGCIACAWGVVALNKYVPCFAAMGTTGASDECHLYDKWERYGSPSLDTLPFSDEIPKWKAKDNLDTTSQAYIGADGEVVAGVNAGLEQFVDLAEQCANFYILERLINDLFERSFDSATGRSYLSPFPVAYGSGLRKEMRAYAVLRRREPLVNWLAKQLSIYLRIACGGELRHAVGGVLAVNTTNKVVYAGNRLCVNRDKKDHEHIPGCVVFDSPRIYKFLRFMGGGKTRTSGWDTWSRLSKRNPAVWMDDCADVFARGPWTGNIGGKPWAIGAKLCADYERGRISATAFIDRCWSLQHHGGCMFNKFYQTPSLMTKAGTVITKAGGWSWGRLEYVLATQAADDYDHLAEFATPDIRYMWREHAEEIVRESHRGAMLDDMVNTSLAAWREREEKAYATKMAARKA